MKLKQLWDSAADVKKTQQKKKLLAKRRLPFLFLWLPAAAHQSCLCDMLWLHLPGSLFVIFLLEWNKRLFLLTKASL